MIIIRSYAICDMQYAIPLFHNESYVGLVCGNTSIPLSVKMIPALSAKLTQSNGSTGVIGLCCGDTARVISTDGHMRPPKPIFRKVYRDRLIIISQPDIIQ
jgi:hypothetical protein